MAADLVKIEGMGSELVASANRFLDAVRLLNAGTVSDEPLTATQKSNILNQAKSNLAKIETTVAAIKAEAGK